MSRRASPNTSADSLAVPGSNHLPQEGFYCPSSFFLNFLKSISRENSDNASVPRPFARETSRPQAGEFHPGIVDFQF
jgi:hypothetical protein